MNLGPGTPKIHGREDLACPSRDDGCYAWRWHPDRSRSGADRSEADPGLRRPDVFPQPDALCTRLPHPSAGDGRAAAASVQGGRDRRNCDLQDVVAIAALAAGIPEAGADIDAARGVVARCYLEPDPQAALTSRDMGQDPPEGGLAEAPALLALVDQEPGEPPAAAVAPVAVKDEEADQVRSGMDRHRDPVGIAGGLADDLGNGREPVELAVVELDAQKLRQVGSANGSKT
jgi:hypothetical protein